MSYNYDRNEHIQQYKGLPKSQAGNEALLWESFLQILTPWILKKWGIENATFEADIANEIREAKKRITAETDPQKIQAEREALEIIEMAGWQDEKNASSVSPTQLSRKEINDRLQDFADKLKVLYLKFGLKILISVKDAEEETGEKDINQLKDFIEDSNIDEVDKW